jgi:hypothetical protein
MNNSMSTEAASTSTRLTSALLTPAGSKKAKEAKKVTANLRLKLGWIRITATKPSSGPATTAIFTTVLTTVSTTRKVCQISEHKVCMTN